MRKYNWSSWNNCRDIESRSYICGYCGDKVGTNHGYDNNSDANAKIYICTNCGAPTLFFYAEQYPGPLIGRIISNLPEDIEIIYKEIKEDVKNSSYTSAVLMGRKLIMHIAVDIAKAKEGLTFVEYIEHLKQSGHIPPNTDQWLEYMRQIGNEKNHEIKIGKKEEAERILKFVEMLLIFIYEFPAEFEEKQV